MDNLCLRFTDFSREEIYQALEKEKGHAGRAGIRLERKRDLRQKDRAGSGGMRTPAIR